MWDGFWTLANGRAWAALPKDLQDIVERNLNAAAKQEREDVRALNASLQGALSQKGMAFNNTDPQLFRAALRKAGFYAEWKEKYGAAGLGVLEKPGRCDSADVPRRQPIAALFGPPRPVPRPRCTEIPAAFAGRGRDPGAARGRDLALRLQLAR